MAEKIKQSELKKKQIVEAALKLFFEKGYEGTSIRMIQKECSTQEYSYACCHPLKRHKFSPFTLNYLLFN